MGAGISSLYYEIHYFKVRYIEVKVYLQTILGKLPTSSFDARDKKFFYVLTFLLKTFLRNKGLW